MLRRDRFAPCAVLLACLCAASAVRAEDATVAASILAEFDAMAALPLWPGFHPAQTPLAFYDGQQTWLVRHPKPPAAFHTSALNGALVFPGRYPQVISDTSVNLAGVVTATADLTLGGAHHPHEGAAVLVHEAFHVYADAAHPTWKADEAVGFVYPIDDAGLFELKTLEALAMKRALAATDPKDRVGWIRAALRWRQQRFSQMSAATVAYERGTELKEGLAHFIQHRAAQDAAPLDFKSPPDKFRSHAYETGRALALLLEAIDPKWQDELNSDPKLMLDALLQRRLGGRRPALPAEISFADRTAAKTNAEREVARLRERLAADRAAFLGAKGWQLIIDATEVPLFPRQFDPQNLARLSATELLHQRALQLANPIGAIEILGRASLTEAAGNHPLFEGVKIVTVTGLTEEPKIAKTASQLTVSAAGVTAHFARAHLTRTAQAVRVILDEPL